MNVAKMLIDLFPEAQKKIMREKIDRVLNIIENSEQKFNIFVEENNARLEKIEKSITALSLEEFAEINEEAQEIIPATELESENNG